MREFDHDGLLKAQYQAYLFQRSLEECGCSSPIFLRRFFLSRHAREMDNFHLYSLHLNPAEGFEEIEIEYGPSKYGSEKYSENELFWMGWFYRYICYTRECSSKEIFRLIKPSQMRMLYPVYHTQGEEWCIASMLDYLGLSQDYFDKNKRIVELMKKNSSKR